MNRKNPIVQSSPQTHQTPSALEFTASAALYGILTFCLFYPSFYRLTGDRYLVPVCLIVAAQGCFVLSRRWISTFWCSFIAGLIYGFSPFALSFVAYHPAAIMGHAALGWLFCPAVYLRTGKNTGGDNTVLSILAEACLSILPFAAIALFYWFLAQPQTGPLRPIPTSAGTGLFGVRGLIAPLSQKAYGFTFSLYHIPLTFAMLGLMLYITVFRIQVTAAVILGVILALSKPVFEVNPVVWACVPMLCCSILVGLGMQAALWAGPSDAKWLLTCAVFSSILGLAGVYFARTAGLDRAYLYAASLHAVSAILMICLFFIAKSAATWHPLRLVLIVTALGFDIIPSAHQLADKIF